MSSLIQNLPFAGSEVKLTSRQVYLRKCFWFIIYRRVVSTDSDSVGNDGKEKDVILLEESHKNVRMVHILLVC